MTNHGCPTAWSLITSTSWMWQSFTSNVRSMIVDSWKATITPWHVAWPQEHTKSLNNWTSLESSFCWQRISPLHIGRQGVCPRGESELWEATMRGDSHPLLSKWRFWETTLTVVEVNRPIATSNRMGSSGGNEAHVSLLSSRRRVRSAEFCQAMMKSSAEVAPGLLWLSTESRCRDTCRIFPMSHMSI